MKKPPFAFLPLSLCFCMLTGSLIGQISLLKDINTQSPSAGTFPEDSIANVNGTLFIATDDDLTGAELWKYTPAKGAELVKDIVPGKEGSEPKLLTAVGSRLFFVANTGQATDELWISDGTAAGTKRVPGVRNAAKLFALGNTLFFEGEGETGNTGSELWKASTAGTAELVKNIRPSSADSNINNLTEFNGLLYFTATDGSTGNELWRSDGTDAGTVQVKDIVEGAGTSSPSGLTPFVAGGNNYLFFAAQDANLREVWRSNGTNDTILFADIEPLQGSSDPTGFTPMGTFLYFSAETAGNGRELWRTDGISVTQMVRDIASGATHSNPTNLISIKVPTAQAPTAEMLLFTATEGTNGIELWRSNGTSGGTVRVVDIAAGAANSNPSNFIKLRDTTILFTATSASNVLQLWKCEGSTGSLVATKVLDLPEGPESGVATIRSLVVVPGTTPLAYFMLNDDEFWKTDGTTAGTVRIKRFRDGDNNNYTAGSFPAGFTQHGNESYFSATGAADKGRELWKTDGTEAGTVMVDDVWEGADSSDPTYITSAGSLLFFSAKDTAGRELWVWDGTDAKRVKDINPGAADGDPRDLYWSEALQLLFFSANDGVHNREIWRSDGTEAGTFMVEDMSTSAQGSGAKEFVDYGGKVFFTGNSASGAELHWTNGQPDGTDHNVVTVNVVSGGLSSNAKNLVVVPHRTNPAKQWLYFVAEAGGKGTEVWRYDHTAGTNDNPLAGLSNGPVFDINTASNGRADPAELTLVDKTLFFVANTGTGALMNRELWKTDPIDAGQTVMVKDIVTGTASSSPRLLTEVGGKLFFLATTPTSGEELWISDGTAAGTKMVKELVAGAGSPEIQDLHNVNGVAVFTADDGSGKGRELWVSDGTPVGTFIVDDLAPGSASSDATELSVFNQRLLYSAATLEIGQEPRIATLDPEISVRIVGSGTELSTGDEVDFGSASLVNYQTVQIEIRNNGLNTLKGISATLTGTHVKEFTMTPKPPATLGQDGVSIITLKFAPKGEGERVALLTIKSNDLDEAVIELNLKGTALSVFSQQPSPVGQIVQVGDEVTFTVGVNNNGTGATAIQWRKVAAAIPGETGSTYKIKQATLADAAKYTVQAKVGTIQAVSNAATLSVVDNTPKTVVVAANANAVLKVDAKGTGLTYKWYRKIGANPAEALDEGTHFKGVTKASLTVAKTVSPDDSGIYYCEVTDPAVAGPPVIGGTTELKVFTSAPVLSTTVQFAPPNGIVSGTYRYDVTTAMNPDATLAATSYTAKNLPTGLKIDKAGVIAGIPTKPGTFKVSVTAINAKGKITTPEVDVVIAPLPDNLAGTYAALVERNPSLNSNMGGRLDMVVTATGTFTGSLTLGTTKYPLKGQLEVDVNQVSGAKPNTTLVVKRTGALKPLTLFVEFEENSIGGNSQVNEVVDDIPNIAAIDGWRQVWNSLKTALANPATKYQTYYTFGTRLAGGPDTLPQGWGFGSFTVAVDGKLTVAGKTPDGETITCAAFVGPGGQILVYQPLYTTTPKGSMMGQMTIGLGTDTSATPAGAADNTLGGYLNWVRPPDTRATARTYEKGFGHTGMPVELDIFGGAYGPVTGDTMVMGITAGIENVEVVFEKGGVESAALDPNTIFDLGAKNKVTVKTPAQGNATNDTATKFTLVAAKGTFTGSFTLTDANPRTIAPIGATPVKRTSTYQGAIINVGAESYGVGYFTLAELPGDGDPLANPVVPPTTATTSDILSGSVTFQKAQP